MLSTQQQARRRISSFKFVYKEWIVAATWIFTVPNLTLPNLFNKNMKILVVVLSFLICGSFQYECESKCYEGEMCCSIPGNNLYPKDRPILYICHFTFTFLS